MANQAIALQARAPQSNILGGAIQQGAQMINMMSQQRAAERQAAVAAQEMELARAAEGRAVTKAELDERKAQQEYMVGRVAYFRDQLPSVKDDVSWNNWLGRVGQEDPEYADELRRASGGRYDADFVNRVSMDAKTYIDKTIATPSASLQYGEGGGAFGVTVGGMGSPRAQEVVVQPPAGAAPATAFPTTGAPATDAQIDEAARKIIRGAGVGELGISAEDFDRAAARANQLSAGGGARMQPISMTAGPQTSGQPDLTAVVQDMMQTKQISQSNLQLMREMAGPDKDAQLAQILKANNIQIVPDAQPQMRNAVFRPGEDAAPQMQQVQSINRPGTQFRGRDPTQSPAPGSVLVPTPVIREQEEAKREPIPQAGARAAAERPSASEAYAKKRAEDQAQADVKFLEGAAGAIETVSNNLRLLDRMIGDARVNEKTGQIVYPPKGRKPHPGFEQVIGVGFPGLRFVPGSSEADFDSIFQQVTGAAFLEAFETLKGGGQITEKEGEKATQAISRLGRNISEKEFIVATNELRSIMRRGLARAEARRARLVGGTAPAAAPAASSGRKTPTRGAVSQQGWGKAKVVGD